METTLKQQAEQYLGGKIGPSEWDEAKAYAERKLALAIAREGDAGGIRRERWYLATLIAETVQSNRFSRFTLDIGLKKGQPAHNDASRPNHLYSPIVSQV